MIRVGWLPSEDPRRVVLDVRTDHDRDHRIAFELLQGEPPPATERLDVGALALLARAMDFGQDLHLEGPVSWTLLANLEEYVDAWVRWRPDVMQPIAITAEEVVDDRAEATPQAGHGVFAFSGGVDSTYVAKVHAEGSVGRRSIVPAGAVLVHGLDIPLADEAGFALAAAGAQAVLDELGVPLLLVRTNWRDVCTQWEMTFCLGLAAVLHRFTDRAGAAVVAADNLYHHQVFPWGSNAVTNPMLGSRAMAFVSAGAAVTRTRKVEEIGGLASVRDHVRVCWKGDRPGENCRRCEKCVRTKLNFLAAGHGVAGALGPLRPGEVDGMAVSSTAALGVVDELAEDLDGLPPELAAEVRAMVARQHREFGLGAGRA